MAFKIAVSMSFKEACQKAGPTLLEPIMKVCVIVPDEYMGDVIGDLNSRRGQIQGFEARSGAQQMRETAFTGFPMISNAIVLISSESTDF